MTTIRSSSGMNAASAFKSVVLPVPVPPEMRMFCRLRTAWPSSPRTSGVRLPDPYQLVGRIELALKFPDGQNGSADRDRAERRRPRASRPAAGRREAAFLR